MGRKKKAPAAPVGGEGAPQTGAPSTRSSQGRGRGRGNAGQGPPGSPGSVLGTAITGPSAERAAVIARPPQVGAPASIPPPAETVQPSRISSGVAQVGAALAGLALTPGGLRPSEARTEFLVPESLRHVSLARRPGFGKEGQKCTVRTNFYQAQCSKDYVYQHDVTIKETPSRGEGEISSKGVRRAVMQQLVETHRAAGLNNCLPAFDGYKILFTSRELPNDINTFEIALPEEDGQARRERRFRVVIKGVVSGRIDMSRLLVRAHARDDIPQDALNALDTVLREKPSNRDRPVGRSFFRPPVPALLREAALGAGLEAWRGYYQSVRPTQEGLALNLDLSTTAFYQAVDVLKYLSEAMGRWDLRRAPSDADRIRIRKLLKGVKVEATHNPPSRRKYRVQDISRTSAAQTMFNLEGHGQVSVAAYFQMHYGYRLRYPHLPCIIAASNRANLPLEVCCIQGGQRYPRKLTDDQIRKMLKITQKRPDVRERETNQSFQQNNYVGDEYAHEFGITVDNRMMEVESRILRPPLLTYRGPPNQPSPTVTPANGEWRQDRRARFVEGITIHSWAVLNFQAVDPQLAAQFGTNLARRCNELGMNMNPQPIVPPRTVSDQEASDIGLLRRVLHGLVSDVHRSPRSKGHSLQLVLCIFPQKSPGLYGFLKRLSVTELGFVTQGCLAMHVAKGPGPVYMGNLALKINVKVASDRVDLKRIGCNFALAQNPAALALFPRRESTIIIGADVSHPAPGDDALSIAAVVASQDWPYQGRYRAIVSTQEKHEEMVQGLEANVKDLLFSFYKANGKLQPQHMVIYRDGVSEGQFMQVLLRELDAIQKACAGMGTPGSYNPKITFVVVQKRHHTRFFPTNGPKDRSGNVPAGTVVDTGITHPDQFDFYLNSHAGLLGTSRPTRYIVLYDENGYSADGIQMLSNALCYTYARCTRSVSIVPPVYYAHLAAAQARCFLDPTGSDSGSASGSTTGSAASSASRRPGAPPVTPLPGVHQEVSNTMYFC